MDLSSLTWSGWMSETTTPLGRPAPCGPTGEGRSCGQQQCRSAQPRRLLRHECRAQQRPSRPAPAPRRRRTRPVPGCVGVGCVRHEVQPLECLGDSAAWPRDHSRAGFDRTRPSILRHRSPRRRCRCGPCGPRSRTRGGRPWRRESRRRPHGARDRAGSRVSASATSPSSVAENNMVWRSAAVWSSRRRTAGMKPMSAIRSASSMTTLSTATGLPGLGRSGLQGDPGTPRVCRTPRRSDPIWEP